VSTNGGDYIQYPPGTDVEVLPVTLSYQLLYGYSAYNAVLGRDDCSKDVSFEALQGVAKNGGLGIGYVTGLGTAIGIDALLEQLGGNQWLFDTMKPNATVDYRFNYYWNQCNKQVSDITLILDGQLQSSSTSLRGISIVSRTINAFRLKITTP
jgi:hypothetical protein